MHSCKRCETLPDGPPEQGVLYLAPPIAELKAALHGYFADQGCSVQEPHPDLLAVPYAQGDLKRFCEGRLGRLSRLEQDDTRVLAVCRDEAPTFTQLLRMQPLARLIALVNGGWLVDLLREERLEVHFQPIVHCKDPTRVHACECLLRGQDGQGGLIPPTRLFTTARAADLLFNLDRAARLASIHQAAAKGIGPRLFINFTPTAIYNPEFCLRSTLQAARDNGLDPSSVVFEVVESDRVADPGQLVRVLEYYRAAGFRVALDDLGAGFSSLSLLAQLRPDYVKLDMELLRGVDADPYKASITRHILSLARSLGVRSIAEGVETMGEWQWLRQNGADLLQGFLFARPSPLAQALALPHTDPRG